MKWQKLSPTLLIVLSGVLLSCASTRVSIGSIPVYPEAEGVTGEQNNLAGQVYHAIEASAEEQGQTSKVRLYALPEDSSWQSVTAFYTAELADTDWQPAPHLNSDSDVFMGLGWTRLSGNREQSLLIVYVPALVTGGDFLVIGLLSD
jgi:hypothetical protein